MGHSQKRHPDHRITHGRRDHFSSEKIPRPGRGISGRRGSGAPDGGRRPVTGGLLPGDDFHRTVPFYVHDRKSLLLQLCLEIYLQEPCAQVDGHGLPAVRRRDHIPGGDHPGGPGVENGKRPEMGRFHNSIIALSKTLYLRNRLSVPVNTGSFVFWRQQGSNLRPSTRQADALPAELCLRYKKQYNGKRGKMQAKLSGF